MLDAARGALVGGLVGLATSAIVTPAFECSRDGLECVPVAFATIAIVIGTALLLGWLAYRLLRADMPWLLAIAGMSATLLIAVVVGGDTPSEPAAMALQGVSGYGLSALSLSSRSPRTLRVVASAILAVGVFALLCVV